MTKLIHTIWFPSHGGNKGIISKIFKQSLADELHGLEYSLIEAKYQNDSKFMFELEVGSEDQSTYIRNKLIRKFGGEPSLGKLNVGDIISTRVVDPNQVGFGIFCSTSHNQDVLLPLFQLRNLVNGATASTRKIVEAYGIVENFPLELEVDEIDKGRTKMMFSETQLDMYSEWLDEGVERVITSMTYSSDVKAIVKQLELDKYITGVYDLDPLTTVIVCDSKTRGNGLLPIIGKKLHSVPIGIYRPKKVDALSKSQS